MTFRSGAFFLALSFALGLLAFGTGAQAQTQSSLDACNNADAAPDAAITGCTDLLQTPGHTDTYRAQVYNHRGLAYYAKGLYDQAIADYTAALAIDAGNKYAYYNRARAYYAQSQYDPAIADSTAALRIDPNFQYAYNIRGLAYYAKRQYAEAITDYTATLRIDPNYKYAYTNRSDVYYAMDQYVQAIADCTAALRLDPNDKDAYVDRGFAYQVSGQYEQAIADFAAALRLDPNTTTYYQLAVVKFDAGRFSDASADFQRSLETGPKGAWDDALWLQLIRWRSGSTSTAQLAANAAGLDDSKFQAALIDMYLGKGTTVQLRDTATSSATTPNERCEATFFIGEWDLMHHAGTARAELQSAVGMCPHNNLMYSAARAELRRMTSASPAK